ncbi:MAG: peroxide stress protein YaaA [Burkholderiales bacterium PBB5]|nr:MAG: peroxide stress protein YaaA [Burkholderiales bacterium PBB5]
MLFLLSPAKSLDYQTPVPKALARRTTAPLYMDQAALLIQQLARLSPPQVAQLMDLSDELAALNVGRYAAWQPHHSPDGTPDNSRPAVLAFNGDVYDGLDARSLSPAQLDWAQDHVVILSGLYGALRPFDALQPYRLEMGTALANPRGKNLYAFWGDTVAQYLNSRQADEAAPVVVNLASQEYFKVADRPALAARVVECVFEDWKASASGGQYKIISFFAKRARGAMARWAIQHKPRSVKALQAFDADGYGYTPALSSPDRLVFRRRVAG